MSNAEIKEAFTIAWGAFALAAWKCEAPLIITSIAACQSICGMIAAMFYIWTDE